MTTCYNNKDRAYLDLLGEAADVLEIPQSDNKRQACDKIVDAILPQLFPSSKDLIKFIGNRNSLNILFSNGVGNWSNLDRYQKTMERLGTNSVNGFLRKLIYTQENGKNYNVALKCNRSRGNDSLVYEYLVGQCLNNFSLYFPTINRSYGIGQFRNKVSYDLFSEPVDSKNIPLYGVIPFNGNLSRFITMFNSNDISELISAGCRDNQRICVFTQYIQGANKFNINKFLSSYSENVGKSKRLFRVDKSDKLYLLTTILHLVYTTLSSLSNFFTHYDLHMENVMLTEVPKGTYLRVNVHNGGNVISYRTKYLPIIIDYGRSFVDCSSVPSYKISNSENLAKRVCSTPDCNTPSQCGRDKGYAYIPERSVNNRFRPQTQDNSFIDITHVNRSFDIRLMSEIEIGFMFVGNSWIENNLNDILSIVRRGWPLHNQDARYGIEENPNFSVNDVFDILSEMIMDPKFESNNNNNFYEKNRYGTLDIWMDRSHPFKFVAN